MRILLVEDDTSLGETILAWLRLDQHAVDWVRRGDRAASALMTHRYDCVLLDRGLPGLPGLSGDALLGALRRAGNTVPVILITAFNALADRVEGLDLGADDYLVKPFELEELSARIRAAARRGASQASAGARRYRARRSRGALDNVARCRAVCASRSVGGVEANGLNDPYELRDSRCVTRFSVPGCSALSLTDWH
jgi:DNA-binding response OmpR family regulator